MSFLGCTVLFVCLHPPPEALRTVARGVHHLRAAFGADFQDVKSFFFFFITLKPSVE